MAKTMTVHTRVTPETKEKADKVFARVGLTTSQAISLFLTASINHNGMPFELSLPTPEEQEFRFAKAIAMTDGVAPSKEAEKIFKLYARGDIDLETAEFAIERMYKEQP